jgi:hypothetical protein
MKVMMVVGVKRGEASARRLISRAVSQCHGRLFLVTPLILNHHVRIVFLLVVLGWSSFYLLERNVNVCCILYATITAQSLLATLAMGEFADFVVCWSKVNTSYFATALVTVLPWSIRLRSDCKVTSCTGGEAVTLSGLRLAGYNWTELTLLVVWWCDPGVEASA